MPRSTYFVQECPTCGRNLQVRVEYLGKRVICQHCQARFEATQPSEQNGDSGVLTQSTLMQRADELLQSAAASGIGLPKQ